MSAKSIKLLSPDNSPIAGALLEDNTVCNISLIYDAETCIIDVIFDNSAKCAILKKGGQNIYVDENGREWTASIVEEHSIFNSPV